MKKIIEKKVYNTETAKEIGWCGNGCHVNDFNYMRQTLYQTKRGQYFLHCEGGANTCYSERVGNMYCAGEVIKLMTEPEARLWAEENLEADEYIEHFGEVEEG